MKDLKETVPQTRRKMHSCFTFFCLETAELASYKEKYVNPFKEAK